MKNIILNEDQFKLLLEMSMEEVEDRTKDVNLNPTDPQKEAGNYKMGHISIKGMKISIENPIGSKRKFKDENGNEGYVIMKNHYGYFGGTSGNGKDGDAVDVFIGPNPDNFERVYVVDQNTKDGEFDESKVMLGFSSKKEAKEGYMSNYSADWKGFRAITGVSLRLFKKWLYRGNKQRKPFSEYVEIQKKKLEESKLNEKAYIDGIKNNKATINYDDSNAKRTVGNLTSADVIMTDKMDNNGGCDTYEVTLKGNIKAYNITSIKGTQVMKYFKHYWDNMKTYISLKDRETDTKKNYELTMEKEKFDKFMRKFKSKVENVIIYHLQQIENSLQNKKFSHIVIYPVKSSSNFNKTMVKELSKQKMLGLKVSGLSDKLLVKDLAQLQKDDEFISYNSDYFNSTAGSDQYMSGNGAKEPQLTSTFHQRLDDVLAQREIIFKAQSFVDKANESYFKIEYQYEKLFDTLCKTLSQRDISAVAKMKNNGKMVTNLYKHLKKTYAGNPVVEKELLKLVDLYKEYFVYVLPFKNPTYQEQLNGSGREKRINMSSIVEEIEDEDSMRIKKDIQGLVKVALGPKTIALAKGFTYCRFERVPFEIKDLANSERMGLQNIYRFNDDEKLVNKELEKTEDALVVVFDDNISGGGTLSDVCYQFKKKNISVIPITFGVMNESWVLGRIPIRKPTNRNGEVGFNYTPEEPEV